MAATENIITLTFKAYADSPQQRATAYKFVLDEHNRSQRHKCVFYELVAVRQGDGFFHCGESIFHVVRNEVYLIPPGYRTFIPGLLI